MHVFLAGGDDANLIHHLRCAKPQSLLGSVYPVLVRYCGVIDIMFWIEVDEVGDQPLLRVPHNYEFASKRATDSAADVERYC